MAAARGTSFRNLKKEMEKLKASVFCMVSLYPELLYKTTMSGPFTRVQLSRTFLSKNGKPISLVRFPPPIMLRWLALVGLVKLIQTTCREGGGEPNRENELENRNHERCQSNLNTILSKTCQPS